MISSVYHWIEKINNILDIVACQNDMTDLFCENSAAN